MLFGQTNLTKSYLVNTALIMEKKTFKNVFLNLIKSFFLRQSVLSYGFIAKIVRS